MRVKSTAKAKLVKELSDGSRLVEVTVTARNSSRKLGTLILREIQAEIHYEGSAEPVSIRLWTTLLDEKKHPATTLAELYDTRWEEELFFRELGEQPPPSRQPSGCPDPRNRSARSDVHASGSVLNREPERHRGGSRREAHHRDQLRQSSC
jgi:hypothetical protein